MAHPERALRVAVLVSGTGSNLRALHAASMTAREAFAVTTVVSDKASATALTYASDHGIDCGVVAPKAYSTRDAWNAALAARVAAGNPDLVVLAGFMRIVSAAFLGRFPARVLNVHPSLLPAFPGVDGPAQALRAGVRVSGCTVHLVDEGLDSGPILAQATVPVGPDDTVSSLHARIQGAEHTLLPAVVLAIVRGDLTLGPRPAWRAVPMDPAPTYFPPLPQSP